MTDTITQAGPFYDSSGAKINVPSPLLYKNLKQIVSIMQFSQEHNHSAHVIKSYDEDSIKVIRPLNEEMLRQADHDPNKANDLRPITLNKSMVIAADALLTAWPVKSVETLEEAHIEKLLELRPEIVILGTGKHLTWPQPNILQPLIQNGVGYEVMNTPAACRTYNILMHEDRRVVAAIMLG